MDITPASDWKKNRVEGIVLSFPSGRTARISQLNLSFFIKTGEIPDLLTPFVIKLMDVFSASFNLTTLEQTRQWLQWLDTLCIGAFMDPQVSKDPKPNEISPDDISYEDKIFLLGILGGAANQLKTFPRKQGGSVGLVQPVGTLAQAALGNNGDSGLGKS